MPEGRVIAIDFDGTICKEEWPACGEPNFPIINAAIAEKEKGAQLILWTCREGDMLKEAVDYCAKYGLVFDAVNENIAWRIEKYGNDSRKVGADEYWDDRSVNVKFGQDVTLNKSDGREGRNG